MVVKLIDDKGLWDKHIEESPYGTLFHLWDFLKIIEKHSGCKLYPFGVYRGDELVCLFPLFTRSFMGLQMVYSPPSGMSIPYLGFVMSATYDRLRQRRKETYVNSVMDEMEAEIKKLNASLVSISTVNRFVDVRPFRWNGYNVRTCYSYVIDLKRPLDEIRDNFDDSLKHDIIESEKLPLSIRPADDVDEFYQVMRDRSRQYGEITSIRSKEYLKDILAAFPENVKADLLYNDNKAIDLAAYCQYKKQFTFWIWPVPNDSLHSSERIAWEYIKNKKKEGLESLEMPGASVKRHSAFISKFNAPLIYNFSITKNGLMGRIGEGMYSSLINVRI